MSFTVTVTGLAEAEAYFEEASAGLVDAISLQLLEVCQLIVDYARSIAPVKTGDYVNSIHVEQYGPLQFAIVADAAHAAIIEFGSAPHEITPSSSKVLAFEIEGVQVFARHVSHPGTAPQFIISRALQAYADQIVEAVRAGVEATLEEAVQR